MSDLPMTDAELIRRLERNIDRMIVERDELEQELLKCKENRKSNLLTIKRLETALHTIADDPVFDTDTQRLMRAHKAARTALGYSQSSDPTAARPGR